jgi:hypothetical protein
MVIGLDLDHLVIQAATVALCPPMLVVAAALAVQTVTATTDRTVVSGLAAMAVPPMPVPVVLAVLAERRAQQVLAVTGLNIHRRAIMAVLLGLAAAAADALQEQVVPAETMAAVVEDAPQEARRAMAHQV